MNPFAAKPDTDPGLVLVIQATLAYKHRLLTLDPWLPFPQNACCHAFGPERKPLPIGALFLLWERWPACTGDCPECGAKVYGVGFGGLLSIGGVVAVCIGCSREMYRHIGGLMVVAEEFRPWLAGTPYALSSSVFGGCVGGDRRALVDALRDLGASNLPDKAWLAQSPPPAASVSIDLPSAPPPPKPSPAKRLAMLFMPSRPPRTEEDDDPGYAEHHYRIKRR